MSIGASVKAWLEAAKKLQCGNIRQLWIQRSMQSVDCLERFFLED